MTHSNNIKKLRCLQIIPNLGFGGVETGVKNIHNYLISNKHDSFIVCEKITDKKYINDCNVFVLNKLFKNPLNYFDIKRKLTSILTQNNINVVHISSRAPAFYFSNFFLKYKNVKLITSVHNTFYSKNLFKRYYNSSIFKGDHIISNSYFVRNEIYKNYKIKKNIKVIERGIDTKYFLNKKVPKLLNSKKIIIFNPSRISSWKGHLRLMNLFRGFNKVLKKRIIFKFISNHKSRYERDLDIFIKNNALESSVLFLKPSNDIKNYYVDSDIVINSSTLPEGFGRTISESLSLMIPAIAPNFGGTKEQLENFDENLLFDINSSSSLESSINYVIQNYKELSSSSRKFVIERYSLDKMINQTLEVYAK